MRELLQLKYQKEDPFLLPLLAHKDTSRCFLDKGLHKISHRTQDCNPWQVVKHSPVWIWFCISALFECIVLYHSLLTPLAWQSMTMNPLRKEVIVLHPWSQAKRPNTNQNLCIQNTKHIKKNLIMKGTPIPTSLLTITICLIQSPIYWKNLLLLPQIIINIS